MTVNKYYIELARDSLNKAVNELRHAEQYLVVAECREKAGSISRTISAVENRNKELGYILGSYHF